MGKALRLPPLLSGGLMLTYRCDNACRHCQYRCGPRADTTWMNDATLDAALAMLADEPRFSGLHLAGGEATLDPDRIEHALRRAAHFGVPVDYLETNGGFAHDRDKARRLFSRLRRAGLNAVLVSISPYHNEFIPLRHTLNALAAAEEVFGTGGVIPWLERFLPLLSKLDPEVPHPLPEFLRANGLAEDDPLLPRLFPLSTGGRAASALRKFYPARPVDSFRGHACAGILNDTSHFHIDPHGHIFTGKCPGLAVASLAEPHADLTPEAAPLFHLLYHGGAAALADFAAEQHGFVPRNDGYISACDLCVSVRDFLHSTGRYPELQPGTFYRA